MARSNSGQDVVVLLGAGASVEAGLPTSHDLTKKLLEPPRRAETKAQKLYRSLYNILVAAIINHEARSGHNPFEARVNVEDLVRSLDFLIESRTFKYSDLVGAMPTAIARLEDEYRSISREHGIRESLAKISSADESERTAAASRLLRAIVNRDQTYPGFFRNARLTVKSRCFDALRNPPNPLDYLEPLVTSPRIACIATLNFDTTVEQACEQAGQSYDVGVFSWEHRKLRFDSKAVRLIKLHGSLDWRMNVSYDFDSEGEPVGTAKERISHGVPRLQGLNDESCVQFGPANKLSAAGPFLDLFRAFEFRLSQVNKAFVIGYSFGDRHINETLGNWLARDPKNTLQLANGPTWNIDDPEVRFLFADWNLMQIQLEPSTAGEAINSWFASA